MSLDERFNVSIIPGTIAIAQAVVMLVGIDHYKPSTWPNPIEAEDLSEDDACTLAQLIRERFGKVEPSLSISVDPVC